MYIVYLHVAYNYNLKVTFLVLFAKCYSSKSLLRYSQLANNSWNCVKYIEMFRVVHDFSRNLVGKYCLL